MRRKPNLHKRMYAVSKDGIGIIAGTMCYSRKAAIERFLWRVFGKHWSDKWPS